MTVKELIKDIAVQRVVGSLDVAVESLCFDSRLAEEGSLYVAIPGHKSDGHDFASAAAGQGAVCVVCEREVPVTATQVIVEDARLALSLISAAFFGHPAKKLKIIGITGTNGKTTTSYLIKSIAEAEGLRVGVIGTSGCVVCGRSIPCSLTTPDPIELNRLLSLMAIERVELVAMEVSAHAAALRKVRGIPFEVMVLSNLTQDHLDFFGTMEKYGEAKKSLFSSEYCKYGLVNADDTLGRAIAKEQKVQTFTYGVDNPADFFAVDISANQDGIGYTANIMDETADIKSGLFGRFNVYNTLAAAAAALMCGVSMNAVTAGIRNLKDVDGRFNVVDSRRGYKIVVDFAHTPDGIRNVLTGCRALTKNKLICVFGCGGDRDRTKRPLMAKAAASLADFCVLTSDNPRFEDPMAIIADAEAGLKKNASSYICIENRKKAIAYALFTAKEGDTVAILGKGAEPYQEICGIKHPYNDMEVVNNLLERMK